MGINPNHTAQKSSPQPINSAHGHSVDNADSGNNELLPNLPLIKNGNNHSNTNTSVVNTHVNTGAATATAITKPKDLRKMKIIHNEKKSKSANRKKTMITKEDIERIVFSVPGTIDISQAVQSEEMTVVKNMPSFSKKFRGFDFKQKFKALFGGA